MRNVSRESTDRNKRNRNNMKKEIFDSFSAIATIIKRLKILFIYLYIYIYNDQMYFRDDTFFY